MSTLGPDLDALRALVVARGLTPDAVGALTPLVTGRSLEALAPVKKLLKRYFSTAPWTDGDDDALADAIGPGDAAGHHVLAPDLVLTWTWDSGRFRLRIDAGERGEPAPGPGEAPAGGAESEASLWDTFDGAVVPEATPSPRTIRFATPPLGDGPSRAYDAADGTADDARVARLFAAFEEVTNVLVGPDFVAVTIVRSDWWEGLLGPVLRTVVAAFTGVSGSPRGRAEGAPADGEDTGAGGTHGSRTATAGATLTLGAGVAPADARAPRRLERAWAELGGLRADDPEARDRILAAARDAEPARRQVAAALLAEAPDRVASRAWERLLGDPSRAVRRSVVDAVADAGRDGLRPLLERALDDPDAWVRWRALRGLAALGVGTSRAAVEAVAADHDLRVRLEATRALRVAAGGAS